VTDTTGLATETTGGSVVRPLFFHSHTDPSLGADAWVHAQIMRHLDRATHEVHLAYVAEVAGQPTPLHLALDDVADLRRVPISPGPKRRGDRSLKALLRADAELARWVVDLARVARYVRRRQIDLLHTADRPRDAVATVVLGKLCRRPSIVHVHVAYGEWMRRGLKWAIMAADHRIAVSEFVRGGLVRAGADPATTHTVLNGIEPDRWVADRDRRESTRAALGLTDDPVVITVCRLFESKGPAALIEAVAASVDRVPDIQLLVVGRDTSRDQAFVASLERLVDELGVRDRVRFLGERSDVPDLMAAADVFAMPSTEEPFGLVFTEAMAAGLPIVAVADGGTLEVVRDGVDGLLSAHGDIERLADNLCALLGDEARRQKLGANGAARVGERFTVRRQADEVAAVYRGITMGPGHGGRERKRGGRQDGTSGRRDGTADRIPGR
jgi:glycosyltransferase involved in cell wall biosynthesis